MTTLVISTSTPACSVALIDGDAVLASIDEPVGRGHAERLLPMIAALPGGGRADRVLVDIGPGSFTGVRVGIAAARGLALGWGVPVHGCTSTALIAAAAFADAADGDGIDCRAVVLTGGHGELFVESFRRNPFAVDQSLASLTPDAARIAIGDRPAIGTGTAMLGHGRERHPSAADARRLPAALVALPPAPRYGRAPDAKPPAR